MAIKYLFRFWNYPRYFVDYFIVRVYVSLWRNDEIKIGKENAFRGIPIIKQLKNSKISIGNNCLLCSRSSQTALGISHSIVLRTLKSGAEISIGNNVRMSGTTICAAEKVYLGNNCVIGADVIISDTDFHSLNSSMRSSIKDAENASHSPVIIGDNVFVGTRSIILKGLSIGNNVVIGAGSVVSKSFGDNSIIAGNPARLVGQIRE